jgi:DNA modification methylase
LREFGFRQPIVTDKNLTVIVGHTRLLAAKKLSLAQVPVHIAEGLTAAQIKAYRIADNRVSEEAEWDFGALKIELEDLKDVGEDLSKTGFDTDELSKLLAEVTEGLVDEDETPEIPVEPKSKLGDIWICGQHRVMCGDSSDTISLDKLNNGLVPEMVFTDPPYNIDYRGVSDKRTVKNDKMSDSDFVDFLTSTLWTSDTMYVCCSWQYAHLFREALERIGRFPKAMIIWNKVNPAQNLDKYFKQHEIIWYVGEFGGQKTLRGDIWEIKRQKNTVHPTMKPVELIEIALKDQPDKKSVIDIFGGSGSTLIAAEKNGRIARLMELEPKYVDVIVKRWQDFTGKKAILESTGEPFDLES